MSGTQPAAGNAFQTSLRRSTVNSGLSAGALKALSKTQQSAGKHHLEFNHFAERNNLRERVSSLSTSGLLSLIGPCSLSNVARGSRLFSLVQILTALWGHVPI